MTRNLTPLNQLQEAVTLPIEDAICLPFSAYRSEVVYESEKKNIFHSDWVFVCAENELANTGDYYALMLAEEPVVVLKGQDSNIRAMSNVCRHRGTLLNDLGKGNVTRMVCPYHAWTYTDEGKLIGVPYAKEGEVDKSRHCLPHFNIEIWNHLIFINLSEDATSLADRLLGLSQYLTRFDTSRFTKTYTSTPVEWSANWKLAMENAMESYHLFKVHRDTLEQTTPTKHAFYLEGSADWTATAGRLQNTSNKMIEWLVGSKKSIYENYVLISLPPSFVGIVTYDSFDWVKVLPKDATSCIIETGGMSTIVPAADSEEQKFAEAFFAEDKVICERVQMGMSAVNTKGGKLIDLERIVVDFHYYLAKRLFNASTPTHYKSPDLEIFLDKLTSN